MGLCLQEKNCFDAVEECNGCCFCRTASSWEFKWMDVLANVSVDYL